MSMFDTMAPMPNRQLEGTSFSVIDADTAVNTDTGESYRFPGVDAPEVQKFLGTERYTTGEAGGEATTEAVYNLMNNLGYTNPKPRLDENGQVQMDRGGTRIIADWYNDAGENFVDRGLSEGIYKPTEFSNDAQDLIYSLGQAKRDREDRLYDPAAEPSVVTDDWATARGMIADALEKEGYQQYGLKRIASDEAELAAAKEAGMLQFYDQNQVETRSGDRTLMNEALNPWSDNFEKSLIGIQESWSGLKNMWGEATDNENLAEVGRLGVERQRERLAKYGTSIVDWKDIDSFSDGIDYVMNNAAMSLPYMAVIGASTLAAPIVGTAAGALGAGSLLTGGVTLATSMLAPASIYAAQTWNEMEGKKNMGIAVGSGILQSAFERLGLEIVVGKTLGTFASKKLMNEAVENLVTKGVKGVKYSRPEAIKMVGNATRQAIAEYTGDAAKAAASQVTAKQIVKSLSTRALRGGSGEMLTEGLQEAVAYTSATLGSDKVFDYNELANRMIAGAVAGATLGTAFSAPGAIYDVGAWKDLQVRKLPAEAKRLSEEGARAERERTENGQIAYDLAKAEETQRQLDAGETVDMVEVERVAEEAREKGTRVQTIDELLEEEQEYLAAMKGNNLLTMDQFKEEQKAAKDRGDKSFPSFEKWRANKKKTAKVKGQDVEVKRSMVTDMNDRKSEHERVEKDNTLAGVVGRALEGSVKLVRKLTRTAVPDRYRDKKAGNTLGAMVDSTHSKSNSGRDLESYKFNLVSMFKNMVSVPENFYAALNNNKITSRTKRAEISKQVYAILKNIIKNKSGLPDISKIPQDGEVVTLDGMTFTMTGRDQIVQLAQDLNKLSDLMHSRQAKYTIDPKTGKPTLGYIQNYLFKFKSLNKAAISADRAKFEATLVDQYKQITPAIAKELTDKILENDQVSSINDVVDENFNVTKGGIVPGSHRKRSLAMSENPEFDQFMEQDIFANVSQAAKSAARFETHRKYIGQNGEVMASLLDKMEYDEGVSREEVNAIASRLVDYLNAESGNYKRPTSDAGKKAVAAQKNLMFLATFTMLGLATVASLVEIALSGRALTFNQIYGREGKTSGRTSLNSFGRELAKMLADLMGFAGDTVRWQDKGVGTQSRGQEIIRDLGYYEWDVGAATVTGVSEVNPLHQKWYELFFKMTGLTGWTNFTRSMRASIANDFMFDHINKIVEFRLMKRANPELVKDNDIQESEEMLRNLGVNVDDMARIYEQMGSDMSAVLSEADAAILKDNMRTGTFNFINDAVALPTVGNRPLIYQDPRFALLTQFQGFMATFSSNHIPKMYEQYIKRGNPSMKYNAFALMTTMIMLGFASQYLKDLIKYGGSGKQMMTAGNPYLDTSEYIQRGIRSSGLLGVADRLIDTAGYGLYDDGRTKGGLDWAWKTISGEAPAAGIINRTGRVAEKVAEGDFSGAGQQLSKMTPILSIFGAERTGQVIGDTATAISDAVPSWSFKEKSNE